jgi:fluoride ion exporter CrcB/FEX
MDRVILVAAGGALGSVGRYQTGVRAVRRLGPLTPWAGGSTDDVAGGFTTFSSVHVDGAPIQGRDMP